MNAARFGSILLFLLTLAIVGVAALYSHSFRHTVFAGDMGLKTLQAETYWRSGELEIPYRAGRFDPTGVAYPFEPPVMFRTETGWVSYYLNLMVLFMIPLALNWLGWIGYLAPSLAGGVLAGWTLASLAKEWRFPNPHIVACLTWIGSPLFFYGLVLWEHSLGVAFALMAILFLIRKVRSGKSLAVPGFLLGISALFRSECALAAGVFFIFHVLSRRGRLSFRSVGTGVITAFLPPLVWGRWIALKTGVDTRQLMLYPYSSSYSPFQQEGLRPHLEKIMQILGEPYQLSSQALLLAGALLATMGLVAVFLLPNPDSPDRRIRILLSAILVLSIGLAVSQVLSGVPWHSGIFASTPAIALVGWTSRRRLHQPFLIAWPIVVILLVLIAPNEGGLQRSCRFLLLPVTLGTVWVWGTYLDLVAPRPGMRQTPGRSWFLLSATTLLLLGLWNQANGAYSLWRHKSEKEAALIEILEEDPDFIATTVWYMPLEMGRIYDRVPILWPRGISDFSRIMIRSAQLDPPAKKVIAIFPGYVANEENLRVGPWTGKSIGEFGSLSVFKFEPVSLSEEETPRGAER